MIRPRTDADIDTCVTLLELTRVEDNYPAFEPASLRDWLRCREELAAWVYVEGDEVVGHVAMHSAVGDAVVPLWSEGNGRDETGMAVISRLFLHPKARGNGAGKQLMQHVLEWAREQDLAPVIDVSVDHLETIAFYERYGWKRMGMVDVGLNDGQVVTVAAYVLPG